MEAKKHFGWQLKFKGKPEAPEGIFEKEKKKKKKKKKKNTSLKK